MRHRCKAGEHKSRLVHCNRAVNAILVVAVLPRCELPVLVRGGRKGDDLALLIFSRASLTTVDVPVPTGDQTIA